MKELLGGREEVESIGDGDENEEKRKEDRVVIVDENVDLREYLEKSVKKKLKKIWVGLNGEEGLERWGK